jgi:hypothetical protein
VSKLQWASYSNLLKYEGYCFIVSTTLLVNNSLIIFYYQKLSKLDLYFYIYNSFRQMVSVSIERIVIRFGPSASRKTMDD